MLSDEQRYLFDLNGYVVVPGVLDAARVARMSADMASHAVTSPEDGSLEYRFGDFFEWGDDWRELIDHPTIMPLLQEILGERFRLDHAYGMAMRATDDGALPAGNLHHVAGMFHHACFYVTHGAKMHNGLIVVSFALSDTPPGAGGFICIPGSHKALYPTPAELMRPEINPLVANVPLAAGDALLFTESLTHGTAAWTHTGAERRAVLLKYCPHYMQWAGRPMSDGVSGIMERQRLILQPPYVDKRETVVKA